MEFEWKEQFVDGRYADAAACGNRIMELWNDNGKVDKEDIVKDAESEISPFHTMIFRDDDATAANKYRHELAAHALRSIYVVNYDGAGNKVCTRLVEKLSIITYDSGKTMERNTYVPINVIVGKPKLLTQLLAGLDRTIEDYKQKRDRLRSYAADTPGVLSEIKARDSRLMEIVNA